MRATTMNIVQKRLQLASSSTQATPRAPKTSRVVRASLTFNASASAATSPGPRLLPARPCRHALAGERTPTV
eukprot:6176568-Pleurochrysis_carterae.AAC.1